MSVTREQAPKVAVGAMLADLQKQVRLLEDDLRDRATEMPELEARLRADYEQARQQERTVETFESWREAYLTQVAVAWVLTTVFARYLEDNRLISDVWLAGVEDRLARARERYQHFFQQNPTLTDREYLQAFFERLAAIKGCGELFGRGRNPLWLVDPSGDAIKALREFFQEIDAQSGELMRVFGPRQFEADTPVADARFLGDLYQDLSEATRKRYALLQTPEFVEEFILDRTLTPALREFGLEKVRLIDPTCGSGHFLLGAFRRLFRQWQRREPGTNPIALAQRALDGVYGVDLNPFAVAIARFRLLIEALEASELRTVEGGQNFVLHLATGDSLLHGRQIDRDGNFRFEGKDWLPEAFAQGDYEEARAILSRQYQAVVGNPPYITDKDKAHNSEVRSRYASCHQKFSLGVPFTERFFELAVPSGYVGMITANSFMKREFGKKLIEEFFPTVDLTHVIDTSGAYIPGHGTPTVILFGRDRPPVSEVVRAALGVRGEPETPADPSQGQVWRSIVDQLDRPGTESDFVTVADLERAKFHGHPWSLSGGGASSLLETIQAKHPKLGERADSIGFASFTGQDEVFIAEEGAFHRAGIPDALIRQFVYGQCVRDWCLTRAEAGFVPYDENFELLEYSRDDLWGRHLWPYRTSLENVQTFGGKTRTEAGNPWWGWYRWIPDKLRVPLSIAFAFVATHNHFVLDRGGKVFKQSAPVIKLPPGASEEEHLALLGLLNSSVANFWARQVLFSKGGDKVGSKGARLIKRPWDDRLERDGTKLLSFPLPPDFHRAIPYARQLDSLSKEALALDPGALLRDGLADHSQLRRAKDQEEALFRLRVAVQEELDWLNYGLYGLLEEKHLPLHSIEQAVPIRPGERAFEIVLARRTQAGEGDSVWFERHAIEPVTEVPAHWPADYKKVVEARIRLIESDSSLGLLERPMCKNRWQREPWNERLQVALRDWLSSQLEQVGLWAECRMLSVGRLADAMREHGDFVRAAALYRGGEEVDLPALVRELVERESVPYLPALRYSKSGLRKRAEWEGVWQLQRRQDAGEAVGEIAVPPKYSTPDFVTADLYRLRGKLDVPKERFISFPFAERDADPTPVVGWAGWNHLERAQALAAYYIERREQDGWSTERLTPLLGGILELLPWLKQWHNVIDPETGERLGDFYEAFLDEELRALGLTREEVRAWEPPKKAGKKRKK